MKLSRQEYWSELPFPSPGDLPNPGIELGSPALQAGSLPSEPPRKSSRCSVNMKRYKESIYKLCTGAQSTHLKNIYIYMYICIYIYMYINIKRNNYLYIIRSNNRNKDENILVNTGDMSDSVLNCIKMSFRELFLIRKQP